ncbi:protein snakeskin [Harmonia axyridis]|uniref:protein snakeskin n=1 Tax=Harmonia axyridis TaxID=115357 RepID=UPI001E279625|nr:protein snakeskin [Harmonia axyridis]
MTSVETIGAIAVRVVKLVLNLIILILYRTGNHGKFLGVGGTWNLNEIKAPDVEIIASGVFVGYFIFTAVSLMSLLFGTRDNKVYFTDVIMGVIGVFMWLTVGAAALHYWIGYINENKYVNVSSERTVGLIMGSLCILTAALYLLDSVVSVLFVVREKLNGQY